MLNPPGDSEVAAAKPRSREGDEKTKARFQPKALLLVMEA